VEMDKENCTPEMTSRGSLVNIVTMLRDVRPGFDSRQGHRFLSLRHRVQTGSVAHPVSCQMGTWGSFLGGKAVGARS
jgi:hypothetical protein